MSSEVKTEPIEMTSEESPQMRYLQQQQSMGKSNV